MEPPALKVLQYMIGSIFFKQRYMMSRTARLTVLWFSLFGEVLAIGGLMYLTDLGCTIEAVAIPVMAVCTMIWVSQHLSTSLFCKHQFLHFIFLASNLVRRIKDCIGN
jgi:hypothetical protein